MPEAAFQGYKQHLSTLWEMRNRPLMELMITVLKAR
jgi:hypothetical protein